MSVELMLLTEAAHAAWRNEGDATYAAVIVLAEIKGANVIVLVGPEDEVKEQLGFLARFAAKEVGHD